MILGKGGAEMIPHQAHTVLKIACMYCLCDMGEKDGLGVEGVSHSVCEACWYERYGGLYPDEGLKMEAAARLAMERRGDWERQILPKCINHNGILSVLAQRRADRSCRHCGEMIARGRLYYSVIIGKGLGAIKHPNSVCASCLPGYLERFEPRRIGIGELAGILKGELGYD